MNDGWNVPMAPADWLRVAIATPVLFVLVLFGADPGGFIWTVGDACGWWRAR